jgi:hypothetical protein
MELLNILEPRHPRLSFAQRVAEICMILVREVNLTDGPLNNKAGILLSMLADHRVIMDN